MKIGFSGDFMLGGLLLDDYFSKKNIEKSLLNRLNHLNFFVLNLETSVLQKIEPQNIQIREKRDSLFFINKKSLDKFQEIVKNSIFTQGNNHCTDFYSKKNSIFFPGCNIQEKENYPLKIRDDLLIFTYGSSKWNVNCQIAKSKVPGCFELKTNEIKEILSKYGKKKMKILNIHWGYENIILPSPEQIKFAHQCIDNGFDLIIGHHPHIIQPYEIYKNHYIFYSLGNFFFPNYYKYNSGKLFKWSENNKYGIIPIINYSKKDITIDVIGTYFDTKNNLVLGNDYAKFFFYKISRIFGKIKNCKKYDNIFNNLMKSYYESPKKCEKIIFDSVFLKNIYPLHLRFIEFLSGKIKIIFKKKKNIDNIIELIRQKKIKIFLQIDK